MRAATLTAVAALALAPAAVSAQTLEIATDQSPSGLDPHVATAFSSQLINDNIYEGLTAIDKDLRVVPALAESWTVSDDQKTYTFRLRPGVTFHNGEPFDAEDVRASIARVLDEATGSPIASRFAVIENVEVVSPEEVRITLSAPFAPFLSQLETLAIMPADHLASGADMQQQPVGTGPFALAEWAPDTYLLLNAHEGYWAEGLPRLDALKFNIVPEAATRQVGLAGGTYQFLPSVDPAIAVTLTADPNVQVFQTLDLGYSLIGMNVSKPPFDDPRVREALNTALDRDEIVQAAYFGLGEPGGPLSPALTDWALPVSEFPCYAHDPERARALLQEAGHTEPVAFTLNALGSVQLVVDMAQVAQQQLNAAGFDATLNVQEQGQFIQDWRNSNFDAFASLNGGFPDPDAYLYRTFLTGGSTNVFKYSDPALDELLERARTLSDPAERRSAYEEAQRMLACRGPIAHIAYGTLITAASPDLTGFQQIADRSLYYLREADLP